MTHNQKAAALIVIGVGAATVAVYQMITMEQMVLDRFSDFDKKLVKKTYRTIMRKAITGGYDKLPSTDAEFDRLFAREYLILKQK